MSFPWPHLPFWNSGECQVCMEKLDDLQKARVLYTPSRRDLFKALSAVKAEDVKVCIVGQDPYPNSSHATGFAFSVPDNVTTFPPTLVNILKEYHEDLGYPEPKSGNLQKWIDQGVLLINAVPVCAMVKLSDGTRVNGAAIDEWSYLIKDIVEDLSPRVICFAFLGRVARENAKYVDTEISEVIETSHPSPRGSLNSSSPFIGSRLFSTINDRLVQKLGQKAIDWRL